MFLKEHPILFLSKIVISTRHVYTCKCGGEPYHLKWNYPVINEPKFFLFLFRAGLFFQLLSELCFPTWLFAFSKVCFKLSDQASM